MHFLCHHHHHHHHHHHLANMELGHFLARCGLTRLEISLMVFSGFFCLSVCSFSNMLGNTLRGVLFICCSQLFLCSCILFRTGVILILLQFLCLFYNLSQSILLFFSHISSLLLLLLLCLLLKLNEPLFTTV